MKFVLLVEGRTEYKVLPECIKRWLDARLPSRIGIQSVPFKGWSHLVRDAAVKAREHLHLQSAVVAVIALLDLYGPTFYPAGKVSAEERLAWARAEMESKVDHPRFRQCFAVHELEAWLLSEPKIFPEAVAKALPAKAAKPETVNFDEPPKALLQRLYHEKLKREYKATVDGVKLFAKLNPEAAYAKCPHLRAMLDEMLALAKAYQP